MSLRRFIFAISYAAVGFFGAFLFAWFYGDAMFIVERRNGVRMSELALLPELVMYFSLPVLLSVQALRGKLPGTRQRQKVVAHGFEVIQTLAPASPNDLNGSGE